MRQALIRQSEAVKPIAIHPVTEADMPDVLAGLPAEAADWCAAHEFTGKPGSVLRLPGSGPTAGAVLFGVTQHGLGDAMALGAIVSALPPATYQIDAAFPDLEQAALGFALSAYRFDRYRQNGARKHLLALPDDLDIERICFILDGVQLARDLINTPANDLGPDELAASVKDLFEKHGGSGIVVSGTDLLKQGFPMVHAVGRASSREPKLADFSWGDISAPKVTLVGKGVIFDTGGLNLKLGGSMALMKKDMGGAANVLGLASMIMSARLPVRLRVIVPCVENAVSGSAFRPGDILQSRKGLTVEIGNTDAEGRLILADALALADEESPDLLIDLATLTGAARVALGPDLPPFYTHDEDLAEEIALAGEAAADPLWRLPLWQPYMKYLDSKVADINHINTSGTGFAGSITAALFLSRFVEKAGMWAHLDIYGWTPSDKPGKPMGGEAQGIRALFDLITERYAAK